MATKKPVKEGSQYCRDCGGKVSSGAGLAWCTNEPGKGNAKTPKFNCDNLGKLKRKFCEHCGDPVNGPIPCPACRKAPFSP